MLQPGDSLGLLVEGIEDFALARLDSDGRILAWNDSAERLTGYTAEEAIGQSFSLFYPPSDGTTGHEESKLTRARRDGRLDDEGWHVRKDGTYYWGTSVLTVLHDESGEMLGFSWATRALTARQRNEEFLNSLLHHALDGIVSIDETGRITSANLSAEKMFGYTEREMLGRNVRMLMPESYAAHHDRWLATYLQTGVAHVMGVGREVRGMRRDGSDFPIGLGISGFEFEGRRHFIGSLRDITERKHLEQQLREAQKMEAVGELAVGIAHDFNNILMVILNHCHILLSRMAADDASRHAVSEISEAGDRAALLVRQLLALSRRHKVVLYQADLAALLANVESMLRIMIGKNVELVISSTARRRVRIDTGLMEQILLNLASNARDAMPRGGCLTIEIRDVDFDESCEGKARPYVQISVRDTGCGMDPKTKSRVFDPFFTTKSAEKGTGLGLTMVNRLVNQLGGSIDVESEVDRGSTFRIYLPASDGGTEQTLG